MATKFKRGQSWFLNWTVDGQRKKRGLGKITEAEAEAERLALEVQLTAPPAAGGPDFISWAEEYADWHSHEYPDSYYRIEQILRCHLIPAFGEQAIGSLQPRQIEGYKHNRIAAGAAPGTVSKEIRTLQAMINRAVEWDVIPKNTIKRVSPPRDLRSRPPRWYSHHELGAIYRASAYGPAWQLLANTGLRRQEALNLQWADIGENGIRVVSNDENRTKSGKWRLIPLSDSAQRSLEALDGGEMVLPPIAPYSLSRAFTRDLKRSDLDGSLHCLRHTYCSHLVMAGVPLRTVQVLAGHASFVTTERYAHLAPDHLRAAAISI